MPEERHFLFTAEQEVAMLRRDRQQAGRLGEGQGDTGGDKYHSINSFGVKHYVYLRGIQRKIEKVFSVPPFAPDRGAIGVPIVDFTIRRDGTLAEAVLLRSSGYPTLDKALVEAVRRAAPYRPFPDHLTDPAISIRVYANVGSCACK